MIFAFLLLATACSLVQAEQMATYSSIHNHQDIKCQEIMSQPIDFELSHRSDLIEPSRYDACAIFRHSMSNDILYPEACWPLQGSLMIKLHSPSDLMIDTQIKLDGKLEEVLDPVRISITRESSDYTPIVTIDQVYGIYDQRELSKLDSVYNLEGNTYTIAADAQKQVAKVGISYNISNIGLPENEIELCVKIFDKNGINVVLPLSCVSVTDRYLSINDMGVGHYALVYILRHRISKVQIGISVGHINLLIANPSDLPPSIVTDHKLFEASVSDSKPTTTVKIMYDTYRTTAYAKDLWNVCIRVDSIHGKHPESSHDDLILALQSDQNEIERSPIISHFCLPKSDNQIQLQGIPRGLYQATLLPEYLMNTSLVAKHESTSVLIDIRQESELIPTYEWQRLHAWHTIPTGLETRLPIGGSNHKEARIPNPFDLQLSMPKPCEYFLRMKIYRDTLLEDILKNAASKCKREPKCFEIELNDIRYDYEYLEQDRMQCELQPDNCSPITAENTDLFSQKAKLQFKQDC